MKNISGMLLSINLGRESLKNPSMDPTMVLGLQFGQQCCRAVGDSSCLGISVGDNWD